MSIEFETALQNLAGRDPRCELLYAQWSYDKRLIAGALQAVGRWFPHYSLHDATHSNAILTHIARLLGQDRVARLSATDLWLLLEAAYHHDLGMVIPDADARRWWGSEEFADHLQRLERGEDRALAQAAGRLRGGEDVRATGALWPLDLARDVTLVLADYGRTQHARRAEDIASVPGLIGLQSPRVDGLIPRRLFGMLGRICAHHGRSFEDTMQLPRRENGLGTDEAHPRFVALMLRLGDLLDLDNGRFCPVLMRSFGPLPPSSAAHEGKHAAIRHFYVGPEVVEVEAECSDYAPYEALDYWLGMLRDELAALAVRWNEAAPFADFGGPPNMGRIEATLRDHWTPEPGRRPRFKVDREAFLDFARGTNLYRNRFMCVRELLQNAVDASLLRLWHDLDDKSEVQGHDDPIAWLHERLKEYPIDLKLQPVQSDSDEGGPLRYRFSIRDRGTGISRQDVQYLQTIGSSHVNPQRRRLVERMPEWMRPSGIFGIGLQSVFLLTDEFVVETHHHETRERLRIVMRSGGTEHADGLYVELTGDWQLTKPGTLVTFEFEVPRLPERVSTMSDRTSRAVNEYDFIIGGPLEYHLARLLDEIEQYASSAMGSLSLNGQPVEDDENERGQNAWFYDRETNLRIGLTNRVQLFWSDDISPNHA